MPDLWVSDAFPCDSWQQSGAVLSIENGYLSVEDSLIAENDSATGAVRLLISSGNFVRTQFLNNTSTGVSSLAEDMHGLVFTETWNFNTYLLLQANYGEAVTVTPSGSNVVVTFENSTFLNNVPNGVRIRLSSAPDNRATMY